MRKGGGGGRRREWGWKHWNCILTFYFIFILFFLWFTFRKKIFTLLVCHLFFFPCYYHTSHFSITFVSLSVFTHISLHLYYSKLIIFNKFSSLSTSHLCLSYLALTLHHTFIVLNITFLSYYYSSYHHTSAFFLTTFLGLLSSFLFQYFPHRHHTLVEDSLTPWSSKYLKRKESHF